MSVTAPAPATQSKVDYAHEILRNRIVGSQYAAGQRLIIDNLVKDIGVSQAPIREALRRLEAEGLVEYGANSGPSIVQLDKTHWFNLMEMKAVMEAYATRAAAPLLSAEEISALRETNDSLLGALEDFDFESWTSLNRRFHEMIHDRCPNALLIQELQRLSQWTDTVSSLVFARERGIIIQTLGLSAGKETIGFHTRIIDAIENGEADASLEEISREHTLVLVRRVQEKLNSRPAA
jgi:DNA-binding GntR family transcriptional regulator